MKSDIELRVLLPLRIKATAEVMDEDIEVTFSQQDLENQINQFIKFLKNAEQMQGELIKNGNCFI